MNGLEPAVEFMNKAQSSEIIMDPGFQTVKREVLEPNICSQAIFTGIQKQNRTGNSQRRKNPLSDIIRIRGPYHSEYGVHTTQLKNWKKETLENLPQLFEKRNIEAIKRDYEKQIQDLYAEIGRLTTQLSWLKKKSGIQPDA